MLTLILHEVGEGQRGRGLPNSYYMTGPGHEPAFKVCSPSYKFNVALLYGHL